jgi:hypothetical protein
MNWSKALEFINTADPTFTTNMRGVPLKDVEAAEAGCKIRLPESYRQFLLMMGVESGRFRATAATQTQNFYDVLELLPDEDYPLDRYFRVSFASDESQISPPDYFLDLARSDGEDAPLVTFEGGGNFNPGDVAETGFTFGEQVTDRIFRFFEFKRRPEKDRVFILSVPPDDAPQHMKAAVDLLGRMRFEIALPPLRRIACLTRTDASAIVAIREPNALVKINIGSLERSGLHALVDQVLVGLRGAELVPTSHIGS